MPAGALAAALLALSIAAMCTACEAAGGVGAEVQAVAGPSVTVAQRGPGELATISAERGLAGHLVAEHLGHEDERTTMRSYARPGSAAAGARARGIVMLDGGLSAEKGPSK